MGTMAVQNRLKGLIADKELRERRKITYRDVAREADIPLSVLASYGSQKARRFDSGTLEKLCEYFGVGIGDILVYSPDDK